MTTSIQKYPKYKESGLEWLGAIPVEWEVIRSKFIFTQRKTKALPTDEQLTVSQEFGVIPQKEFMEKNGHRVVQVITGADILKHVEPFDFVISMRSFQGGLELSKVRGSMSSAYVALVPSEKVEPRFFSYLLKSKTYIQALQCTTNLVRDGQALRFENFSLVDLPVFPATEQAAIADFLDRRTAQIDSIIKRKESLINSLKEKRAALITRAVTKGLDHKAEMKSSGIDWIGNIPKVWSVRRGKFVLKYKKEPNSHYQCDHILALTLRGVINKEDYEASSLVPTDYASYQIFYKDDLVFKLIDLENFQTSRVGIVPQKGIMSPAYLRIVPRMEMVPRYCYWAYYSLYLQGIFNFLGMGVRSTLNQWDLLSLPIQIPDAKEQKQISDYLDKESDKIDKAVSMVEAQIGQLKEYRSSLIYSAVTGKIKI